MAYIARNISGKYAILLKQQIKPDGVIDLETAFEGFCKPKKTSRAEPARYSEFTRDQFPEFLAWVTEKADPREWEFEFDGDVEVPTKPRPKVTGAGSPIKRKNRNVLATREANRKADTAELSPKQIALLPFSDSTKKTLSDCTDVRKLKAAVKMAKNLAGQERVRNLLEGRLQELASEGIV
jgi:hypothetical protein